MRIHILGICGTFMGGIAMIARQLGHQVIGTDANVYPPMSDTLRNAGIEIFEGYEPQQLAQSKPDLVIIGNALSRGNPMVEAALDQQIPYTSGPQWLAEQVLHQRHVLAVAGTHGKTTTSSLLAWILEQGGLEPGYLIGGVPHNFTATARLGAAPFFVIEADEYDTAFFDKRSKFIHYRPRTLIMNNLEFDHADIFPDLEAIKLQFQYLLRGVPSNGLLVYPHADKNLRDVLIRGCWTSTQTIGLGHEDDWQARNVNADGSQFELWQGDKQCGTVNWGMLGQHNIMNALAATAAAQHAGLSVAKIIDGLQSFQGVKRRLEVRGVVNDITVYDDFAHHPTAIETTLAGLRAKVGDARIIAVLQFGSNTMKLGSHQSKIVPSLQQADQVVLLTPDWDVQPILQQLKVPAESYATVPEIIDSLIPQLKPHDHVLVMSNKGFDGIHQRLLDQLQIQPVSS